MTPTVSLHRRIKRRIWSRTHSFLAVCPPGLEAVCRDELCSLGIRDPRVIRGGVEFQGRLDAAYNAHLRLRTAGRIWMRVAAFRAGAYEALFRKAGRVPWETLLAPGTSPEMRIVLQRSRITHRGKTADTLHAAIQRRFHELGLHSVASEPDREPGPPAPTPPLLLVRIVENAAVLSLDMSGSPLHRRGYRSHVSRAPLRETLAAGLVLWSGWHSGEPFLDPMCGSGVFPLEAGLLAAHHPPGLLRDFAFMEWPCFRPRTWNHLKEQARKAIRKDPPALLRGRDIDPRALRAARENARRAGLERCLVFEKRDFFSADAPAPSGTLFLNPPFGKRLASASGPESLYRRIGKKLISAYRGWQALVLVPTPSCGRALGLRPERILQLDHGGIPIQAWWIPRIEPRDPHAHA